MLTCLYDIVGYALLGSMCLTCLFPCYMVRSLSSHAYMLGIMFFHVYVLSFYMFTCIFLCLHVQIYVLICLCAWIYVLHMLYDIFHMLVRSMPCLCAQAQAMFVMSCAIVSPFVALSFFIVFQPNGWDLIQTLWSLSSSVHLGPHQRVWITPICMSMLARFYALCLCQPLQFKALPHLTPLAGLWLYGYIRCP